MGRNVFISYKYGDRNVCQQYGKTTNDYVLQLKNRMDGSDTFYDRSEDLSANSDLSSWSDGQIERHLADKIFYTSITIVLVSAGMRENKPERDQWMPWEISYSLKEKTRGDNHSYHNAILAVVLPDQYGGYEYAMDHENTRRYNPYLFDILVKNRHNLRNRFYTWTQSWEDFGDSYIQLIEWPAFMDSMDYYLDRACKIRDNIGRYDIVKQLS
jgi:hypothetical protein